MYSVFRINDAPTSSLFRFRFASPFVSQSYRLFYFNWPLSLLRYATPARPFPPPPYPPPPFLPPPPPLRLTFRQVAGFNDGCNSAICISDYCPSRVQVYVVCVCARLFQYTHSFPFYHTDQRLDGKTLRYVEARARIYLNTYVQTFSTTRLIRYRVNSITPGCSLSRNTRWIFPRVVFNGTHALSYRYPVTHIRVPAIIDRLLSHRQFLTNLSVLRYLNFPFFTSVRSSPSFRERLR